MLKLPTLNQDNLWPALLSVGLHVLLVIVAVVSWSRTPDINVPSNIRAVVIDASVLEQMRKPKDDKQRQSDIEKQKRLEQDKKKQQQLKEKEKQRKAKEEKARQRKKAAEKQQLEKKKEQERLALKKKKEEEKKQQEKKKQEEKKKERKQRELKEKQEREKREKERLEKEKLRKKKLEEEKRKERERLSEEKRKQEDAQKKAEEARLADQAKEFEELLQQQLEAESQAARREQELTEIDRFRFLINQAVKQNWQEPPGSNTGLVAELRLQLLPTGELLSATLLKSSGNTAFDQSALNAANSVRQYPVPSDAALFDREFRSLTLRFAPK